MLRIEERYWHCRNRACGMTALSSESDRELEARRCVCGSLMEKHRQPGVFSYLDFLREEPYADPEDGEGKEQGSWGQ